MTTICCIDLEILVIVLHIPNLKFCRINDGHDCARFLGGTGAGLPACLTKARSGNERFKIALPGTIILAERLSAMIAKNDHEVSTRRRERPIAGM
jgi:hypothetical protein